MKASRFSIACIAADLNSNALGGAEVAAIETIKKLSSTHDITLFVGNKSTIQTMLPKQVKVVPIYYPRVPSFMGLAYILFGTPQIAWHLRKKSTQILWAKQEFPQAVAAAIIKAIYQFPLYVTIQNPKMHEQELVISSVLAPFARLLRGWLTNVLVWTYQKADVLAAVSNYSAAETKKMGGRNVIVIPNGVDLKKFQAQSSGFEVRSTEYGVRSSESNGHKDKRKTKTIPNTFTIVSTSSLIPRNGLDTLIQAVSLLPKEIKWRLLIAGEGGQERNLKSQISSLKLDNQISLLGRVGNDQVPRLLSKADVYVRPSRHEGFGVSFIEAMAMGVPVIATPVGGIPDFVIQKKTGLLVPVDDPQSLANAIVNLAENRALRQQLARNAIRLVSEKYQWNRIADTVEEAMESIIVYRNHL